jgi:hypothetical protein
VSFANTAVRSIDLMTVKTELLRDKLNKLYDVLRVRPQAQTYWGRFSYLWDLKELALLERRDSVQVPTQWLDEFEQFYVREEVIPGRAH